MLILVITITAWLVPSPRDRAASQHDTHGGHGWGPQLRKSFRALHTLGRDSRYDDDEEEQDGEGNKAADEEEDVLYNLAQTINLSYFDSRNAEVIGDTTEVSSSISGTCCLPSFAFFSSTDFELHQTSTPYC